MKTYVISFMARRNQLDRLIVSTKLSRYSTIGENLIRYPDSTDVCVHNRFPGGQKDVLEFAKHRKMFYKALVRSRKKGCKVKEVEREKVKRELRCIVFLRSALGLMEKLKADFCVGALIRASEQTRTSQTHFCVIPKADSCGSLTFI